MKFRGKTPAALPAQHQRLHYCGVCKAMGKQYGQRTRFLLNYDAIYLSELLTFIGGEKTNYQQEWAPALLSYNCFRLPKQEDIPTALKYAAAVNVLLAGVKLEDNIQDKGGFIWRTANHLYQDRVAKAEEDLKTFGLDLEGVDKWLRKHAQRELEPLQKSPQQHLAYLSEATAHITGLVFRQGAIAVGKSEEAGKMKLVGEDFGKMIYLLDAYRDFEKDHKKGEYNPIKVAFGEEAGKMTGEAREMVQGSLLQSARLMLDALQSLPLSAPEQAWFRDRIEENLKEQLGLSVEEVRSCTTSPVEKPKRKISFATRWQFLRNMADTWHLPKIRNRNGYWKTAFAFGAMGFLALLFPSTLHARADWFAHIDPDFLSRFGDLHPDWSPAKLASGDCCNECCQNGRCCDTCCKNCTNDCEDACNRIVAIFATIAVLFVVGITTMIIFIVRGSRRKAQREAEMHNANIQHYQAPQAATFRTVVQRPDRDTEVLLAAAHDWFGAHYPHSMPQLIPGESHRTLVAEVSTPVPSSSGGQSPNFGNVNYRVQIFIRPGALALEFDNFDHVGGMGCPAGGLLAKPTPQTEGGPLDLAAWKYIKHRTASKLKGELLQFEQEV